MQQLNHKYGQPAISEKKNVHMSHLSISGCFWRNGAESKSAHIFVKKTECQHHFIIQISSVVQEEQTCLAHGETSCIIHLALNDQSSNEMKHSGQESKAQKMGCSRHQRVGSKKLTLNHTFFCQKSVTGDFFLV